jgi:hypothetical protein
MDTQKQAPLACRHYQRAEDVPAEVARDFGLPFTAGVQPEDMAEPTVDDDRDAAERAFDREFSGYEYEYEDPRDGGLYEGSVGCEVDDDDYFGRSCELDSDETLGLSRGAL